MNLVDYLFAACKAIHANRARNIAARSTVVVDGAIKNGDALALLKADGWRRGYTRETITDGKGQTHVVWVPPAKAPLGVRMHAWIAFLPTAALIAGILFALYETPPWARGIVGAGIGVGVMAHEGWLPNPLHWIGL